MKSTKMQNAYLSNTTPEQRRRVKWEHRNLARQGYYPWGKAPFGFKKTKLYGSLPTLEVNDAGRNICLVFQMIIGGEISSYREVAGFLKAAIGIEIAPSRAKAILHNYNYKGLLDFGGELVVGKYAPPVPANDFDVVQIMIAKWGNK